MKNSPLPLIDVNIKELQLKRARPHFENHNFLFQYGEEELAGRLQAIRRTFQNVLNLSFWPVALEGTGIHKIETHSPLCDFVPSPPYDLIVSCLSLHWVEDLPRFLKSIHALLAEDGLFMGIFLGGDTLIELRESFLNTELELQGGASPRVLPFVRPEDGPKLMSYAGFQEPVIDCESIQVAYSSLEKLLHDLRFMGENNALTQRKKQNESRTFFKALEHHYRSQFEGKDSIDATFEFLTFTGWK